MQSSFMHSLAEKGQDHAVPTKAGDVRRAAARWDEIYERMPIAVYVCDIDGLIVQFNDRAKALWGRAPKLGDTEQRFCGAHRLLLHDGTELPHARTPMAEVLRTGQPSRSSPLRSALRSPRR